MAEFVQVMKEWQRMCEAMKHCDECPMSGTTCWYGGRPDDSKSDFDYYEQQIMEWSKEKPEPVYPSWSEFLNHIGLPTYGDLNSPIRPDIAKMLGLEPKE